jgi:hypothetical protein
MRVWLYHLALVPLAFRSFFSYLEWQASVYLRCCIWGVLVFAFFCDFASLVAISLLRSCSQSVEWLLLEENIRHDMIP